MAAEDLILRMRSTGARAASRDVDRTGRSVRRFGNDADRAGRKSRRAYGSIRLFSNGFRPMIGLATSAGAALGIAGFAGGAALAINAASNLSEEINKTKVVFRGHENTMLEWSKTASDAFGQSRRQALEAAGIFGNMLVPMGFARGRAGEMSRKMVELASDMASFNNASPQDTLDALRAGLAGETEPLRRFGVFLNDARQKSEAMNLGLYDGKGALGASAKAAATYSLILKDTKDAQGDFGRTSDSLANQQRTLRAQLEDLEAELGQALLPTVNKVVKAGVQFVKGMRNGSGAGGQFRDTVETVIDKAVALYGWVNRNKTALLALGGSVLAGVVAFKAFMFITKVMAALRTGLVLLTMWRMGTLAMTASTWGLNGALWANPIGLIVIAVAALAAGFIILWKRSEKFRDIMTGVWDAVREGAALMFDVITFGIRQMLTGIGKVAGVAKHIPGLGKLGAVEKGALGAAATLAGVSDMIRGKDDDPKPKSGGAPPARGGAGGRRPVTHPPLPRSPEPGANPGFGFPPVIESNTTVNLDGKKVAKNTERHATKRKSTR